MARILSIKIYDCVKWYSNSCVLVCVQAGVLTTYTQSTVSRVWGASVEICMSHGHVTLIQSVRHLYKCKFSIYACLMTACIFCLCLWIAALAEAISSSGPPGAGGGGGGTQMFLMGLPGLHERMCLIYQGSESVATVETTELWV
jgi:hypothetical protein